VLKTRPPAEWFTFVFHIFLFGQEGLQFKNPRPIIKNAYGGKSPKKRERSVAGLIYSFAQLEAFTAVAENGSLVKPRWR
jgi:hypothetical protein